MRSLSLLAAIILALVCTIEATAQPQLQTISPNGGERLNAGDTVMLTWSGTTKRDTVRLEYSLDSGRTWLKIAARVSDTSYRWRVPDTVAKYCLFRVAQVYGVTGTIRQSHHSIYIVISSVDFSPDGSKIVGRGRNGMYGNARIAGQYGRIGDIIADRVVDTLSGTTGLYMFDVRYSPDGSLVTAGSIDSTIRLWETATGKIRKVLKGHTGRVYSVYFSHDGQYLVSTGSDKTVRIWAVLTDSLVRTISGFANPVSDARFDPTGHFIVVGSGDTIKVLDASTGTLVRSIYAGEAVYRVSYSHNGRLIASSHPSTVRIWDAATGDSLHLLPGIKSATYFSAFSSDDSRLATTSPGDRKIKQWDVMSGELIDTIASSAAPLYDIVYSPDGTRIASTDDGLMLFDLLPTDASDATWSIVKSPSITVTIDTFDFKQVAVNQAKDSLVRITNSSSHPVTIDSMALRGSDAMMFSTDIEVLPTLLAPGDILIMFLRFAPTMEKESHAQLVLNYTGTGSPAVVELKGNGVESTVSVQQDAASELMQTMLKPVRPNPARDAAEIEFYLSTSTHTRITVVDERGNAVVTVTDGRLEKGWHSVPLDLSSLPSGEYFCRLSTGEEVLMTGLKIVR